MRKRFMLVMVLSILTAALLGPMAVIHAQDSVTITVAVVNNPDQRRPKWINLEPGRKVYPRIAIMVIDTGNLNFPKRIGFDAECHAVDGAGRTPFDNERGNSNGRWISDCIVIAVTE